MKKPRQLTLETPVQYLKGIGPGRAARLARLGINTVGDLLYLIPRRYIDYSRLTKIGDLKVGDDVTISGKIMAAQSRRTRTGSPVTSLAISDGTGIVTVRWFNRPDLKGKFRSHQLIIASGAVSYYMGKQLVNPNYEVIETENDRDSLYAGRVIPVYPLTEGLNLWEVRRAVKAGFEAVREQLADSMPDYILKKNGLLPLRDAVGLLHFPQQVEQGTAARRRLVYDELLIFELGLALRRREVLAQKRGFVMTDRQGLTQRFMESVAFKLTSSQQRVLDEIRKDMASLQMMNRLLQGDVGSGKTVVAIYAMLIAVDNGFQAALMAPTEILAEQHYNFYAQQLTGIGVANALLTGSLPARPRDEVIQSLKSGATRIVFGTHALIESAVEFYNLGLVVVDEQHRFGVAQRARLVNKGMTPDFLVMTATPIPRTLSMTLYGDLDVSTLDEKPPGRKPIETRLVRPAERGSVFSSIRARIKNGHQAFIVYPVIEASERLELRSAKKAFDEIRSIFPDLRIGLIHGRMSSAERIQNMEDFRAGRTDVMVSTTVIEVGVDVPNATIMAIEHPERFGLAQLHQLRGRVGRGQEESSCFLILDRLVSKEAFERLAYFEKTDDGFCLAEEDLKLRGPGELLGLRQHGLPDFRYADIVEDIDLVKLARDDAFRLVEEDPGLDRPEHQRLRDHIKAKYRDRLELLGIG